MDGGFCVPGCRRRLPQARWHQMSGLYSLTVPEATSPRPGCGRGLVPPGLSVGEAASCRSPLPGGPGFCGLWRHLSGLRPRPHAASFPGLSDLLPLSQGLWSLGLVSTLSPE